MKLSLLTLLVWSSCVSAFVTLPTTTVTPRVILHQASITAAESPAQAVVSNLLDNLLTEQDTNQCIKLLLHSSTHTWRSKIYDAVGAPSSADETKVATSIANAMAKPDNQFALLLGKAKETYVADFPTEAVETGGEGKCWLECRLYDKNNDGELLVVSGWDMQQNPVNGEWLIDRIDWQDFREAFYPGLGREEWARAFV
ncbi:expressed unknown protein [Seminavis robusta]|uniref:Uncharacterized protein n=1 Tax=Seminavis robusta TaxID=568900 RepID=A0A9N8E2K6_9STRA|nr:expressed unknown protein [Seminavis robusta]|eukprot:Sro589_g171790.1 n/a (199) ;mRNA; r:39739-40335